MAPTARFRAPLLAQALVLGLLTGCATDPSDRLAEGPWSGPDVLLVVGPDSSLVYLPCRFGVVREPIALDGERRFSVPVVLVFRGGVAPAGPALLLAPDRLDGRLRGSMMELTVTTAGPDFPATYRLFHRSGPPPAPCP